MESTEKRIEEFSKRHACEARRDPSRDFWHMSPLCPPRELNALDAIKQLHHELQQWAQGKRYNKSKKYSLNDIEFWDEKVALQKGHIYGAESNPLAQIAWLNGPENWPAILMQGRSYGSGIYKFKGIEYYLEPANKYVLSMEFLRSLTQQEQYNEIRDDISQIKAILEEVRTNSKAGIGHNNPPSEIELMINEISIEIHNHGINPEDASPNLKAAPNKLRNWLIGGFAIFIVGHTIEGVFEKIGEDIGEHYHLGNRLCQAIEKLADDYETWLHPKKINPSSTQISI